MKPEETKLIVNAISVERTKKKRCFEKDDDEGYKVHCKCENYLTQILKKLGQSIPELRENYLHSKGGAKTKKRKTTKLKIKPIKKCNGVKKVFSTYFKRHDKEFLISKAIKNGFTNEEAKQKIKDFISKMKESEKNIRKKRFAQDYEDKRIHETFQKEFEKLCMRLENER